MAMIQCNECGKEISDAANTCIHCGFPLKTETKTKFCKHCGAEIHKDAVTCVKCGLQVEELKSESVAQPNIIITNTNSNVNTNTIGGPGGKAKNKWTAFLLCLFLGWLGAHKFYEGKILFGLIYLFTAGLFGIGIIIDLITLLLKPNPYYA